MATKYIVDNLSGQTITGNLTINGNLSVTGVTAGSLSTYKALLTQTGPITGYNLDDFNDGLIIGETYTITVYNSGDDFSNVANVLSGTVNTSGCTFIATGEIPTNYNNGSQLDSSGGLVVTELENNLGYEIAWLWKPFDGYGYYVAVNNDLGPVNNTFPRSQTYLNTQINYNTFSGPPSLIQPTISPYSFMGKDNIVILNIFDFDLFDSVDDRLYYTPVEIMIDQNLTPIVVSGTVETSYPINNLSMTLTCDGNNLSSIITDVDNVDNITELIDALNNNSQFNYLGTYSDDGSGGVLLTMTTDTKNYFCQDGTFTFEIFND